MKGTKFEIHLLLFHFALLSLLLSLVENGLLPTTFTYRWSSHVNIFYDMTHDSVLPHWYTYIVDFSCYTNMLRRRDVYAYTNMCSGILREFSHSLMWKHRTHFIHNFWMKEQHVWKMILMCPWLVYFFFLEFPIGKLPLSTFYCEWIFRLKGFANGFTLKRSHEMNVKSFSLNLMRSHILNERYKLIPNIIKNINGIPTRILHRNKITQRNAIQLNDKLTFGRNIVYLYGNH